MKHALFFVLFVLSGLAVTAAEPLRILESEQMESRILGQKIPYSLLLPEGFQESGKRYPVVYLLHGLGDDETSWLEYGRLVQVTDELVRSGKLQPMIYVMPMGFRSYYVNDYKGLFPYEDMFIKELVPHIDSLYPTLAGATNRALVGYSMGGFGAWSLYLRHPEVFGAAVPLSMSVRTDAQYMTEEAPGWDNQWGRLFGGEGQSGEARITDYYKLYSPFHLIPGLSKENKTWLNLLLVNGDEEETLCRSNEELHALLHHHGIRHQYRVTDGGHSFQVWRAAMPEALLFIHDCINGPSQYLAQPKVFAKDEPISRQWQMLPGGQSVRVILPETYDEGNRQYPLLIFGVLADQTAAELTGMVTVMTEKNQTPPAVLVFLEPGQLRQLDKLLPQIESHWRIRSGKRMRALLAEGSEAAEALRQSAQTGFSSCILLHGVWSEPDDIVQLTAGEVFKGNELRVFQLAADEGSDVSGNGLLHILLREKNIHHEYRLHAGKEYAGEATLQLQEALHYVLNRFHR